MRKTKLTPLLLMPQLWLYSAAIFSTVAILSSLNYDAWLEARPTIERHSPLALTYKRPKAVKASMSKKPEEVVLNWPTVFVTNMSYYPGVTNYTLYRTQVVFNAFNSAQITNWTTSTP